MTLCIKIGAVDTLLTVLQKGCSDCTSASATHGPLALTYAAQCILKMAPVEECKSLLIAHGGTLLLSLHTYRTSFLPRPTIPAHRTDIRQHRCSKQLQDQHCIEAHRSRYYTTHLPAPPVNPMVWLRPVPSPPFASSRSGGARGPVTRAPLAFRAQASHWHACKR